jgi:hypothetical protein
MASVSRLHKNDGADPLRTTLAAQLEEAREARQAVYRQRAAIERARSSVRAAESAVTASEEAVVTARADHISALATAAATDKPAPKSRIPAARQAVVDANEEVEALKAALAQLKAGLPGLEAEHREADIKVDFAISAILVPHAEKLIERGRRIAAQLAPVRQALLLLRNDRVLPAEDFLAFARSRKPLDETMIAI